MYENMMHRFRFGNIDQPGIYVDENLMRMCHTHRMMFLELSEALYRKGEKTKAVEVIDYAEKMLPDYNVPYDYSSASMAAIRYAIGDKDGMTDNMAKADTVMESVAQTCVEYLRWADSLSKRDKKTVQSTVNQNLGILGYVLQNLNRYRRDEIFSLYYPEYEHYAQ